VNSEIELEKWCSWVRVRSFDILQKCWWFCC